MPAGQVQLMVTVVDLPWGTRVDTLLEVEPRTPVEVVARQLGQLVRGGAGDRPPVLYVGGDQVDPRASLANSPIRDGAVIGLDDPDGSVPDGTPGGVELRIVGGPQAGTVHSLPQGKVAVGKRATVRVADPYLADEAFRLEVNGECRVKLASGVHARLDGQAVTGTAPWPADAQLAVGASLFEWAPPAAAGSAMRPSQDGVGLDYNRPPRVRPRSAQTRFRLPAEPKDGGNRGFPLLMAFTPLVAAVGMALVVRQWGYLLVSLLTPVGFLGQHFVEKRQGRKSFRKQLLEYEERRARIEADARAALAAEQALRRRDFPDPARILEIARRPRPGLWERRRYDLDFLVVRVGTGEVPSEVRVEDPDRLDHEQEVVWRLADAPVTVPLRDRGVVGVAGDGSLGRWIVAQVAALHSPLDVRICLLTDDAGGAVWDWVRWLPHARPVSGESAPVWIGNDEGSVARRIEELVGLLTARQRAVRDTGPSTTVSHAPEVLVVLDGARRLRDAPGVIRLLREGPAFGIHAVCLDLDEALLPAECTAVVAGNGLALRVNQTGADVVDDVRPDRLQPLWYDSFARALAPLRDISDQGEDARLPGAVRLLDLLGLEPPTGPAVAAQWRASGPSTRAVLGVGPNGPVPVDLDSQRDGPHGLIAGTTGSGKSELLQTLIAALAVANRPDEMTFVLVDYKGGSAFAGAASLPHTVGLVTDLDGHLTQRALESLAAELRRRERLLLSAGAKDIDDYQKHRATAADLPALPRLLIVIDEFASLVAELPEFVAGLVDIARRGRSLGVHLLLATQRPAGVVTADIRANTNLRIALRVTDPAESADIIEAPDAARIPQSAPGRFYMRSGSAPVQVVQAARVGGERPGQAPPDMVRHRTFPLPWNRLGWNLPAREEPEQDATITDLAVLVDAIRAAATAESVAAQPSPWLPPLPEVVTLDQLRPADSAMDVPFGLTDRPAAQDRHTLSLDLSGGGHLVIAGSAQSGRSTVLRTIAGSVAARVSPADAHLYAIDCGANALLPLDALPHTGAVVTRDQVDRVERLLSRLHNEVSRRQQLLAASGWSDIAEQRAQTGAEEQLPYLVLLLDRWEGFLAAYENYDYGRLVDSLVRLLREGPAVGLRAVVTGDRSTLSGPVSTVFDRRIILRMADPGDYGFAGLNERQVPAHMPNGRTLEQAGIALRESQIALLDENRSGTAQIAALHRIARTAAERCPAPPRSQQPLRVDPLPVRVTTEEALALDPEFTPRSRLWALIGVGGDDLAPVGVDLLADGPGFVIAGPPRSGRSTALLTITRSLLAQQLPVLLIAPRRSPLRDLADARGVLAVLDASADPDAITAAIGTRSRYAVVVDDAELLTDTPLDDTLAALVREARDGEYGLILAGTADDLKSAYRGFAVDTLRSRSGLLLAAQAPDDGDLFGIRLPRNAATGPVGRALLVRAGTAEPVHIALPDG